MTKSSALDISKPLEEEKVDEVEPSRRLDAVRERGRVDEPSCTSADMVVVAGWTTKGGVVAVEDDEGGEEDSDNNVSHTFDGNFRTNLNPDCSATLMKISPFWSNFAGKNTRILIL